jgi:flagellar biosynthesis protein FlhF
MRQALRLVRDQLGPEAVILTSKRTPFGVEVTAAVDFDAARVEAAAAQAPVPAAAPGTSEPRTFRPEEFSPPAPPARPEHDPYTIADSHDAADDDVQQSVFARLQAEMLREEAAQVQTFGRATGGEALPASPTGLGHAISGNAAATGGEAITAESLMSAELKAMRRILETQMAQLAWNDLSRRAPIHTEILRDLTEVGLTQDFAAQIVAQLPAGTDLTKAHRLSIALIAQRIAVTGDRWLDKGGRVALVGPTGVGKTTALAKLAVRWVLRHGPRSIALISADSVRIGAHDHMQALGQMLDVPVYIAETLAEIPKYLQQLGQARLVLIDTPGMSQRDPQLATRMAQLAQSGHGLETALVLAASTQAGAIAETVARFASAKAASALLTKVDEAASLGGILSVLARAELPISYVSEGQRVPEDLRPARALELVSSAVQLAKTSGAAADEDLLRRRYGEVAHALA